MLFRRDHSELLYYILRQLVQDQLAFLRGRNAPDVLTIEIDEKDLLEKVCAKLKFVFSQLLRIIACLWLQAKQIDIHDLKPFYKSKIFEANNFVYDPKRKVIVHTIPEGLTPED